METIVILVVAAGISAAVVWWATMPPGTSILPKRNKPSRRQAQHDALSFRETFQSTGPDPTPFRPAPDDGFMAVQRAVPDDRPPPVLSLLRLVFAIGLVAAIGVAVVALLGLLIKLQLDKYLGGG
jgi:hypothetical protein